MTYHLSSEQYQRGVNHVASARVVGATPGSTLTRNPAYITGLAKMLAHLADIPVSKVMRDSDARLTDLDTPLTAVESNDPNTCYRHPDHYVPCSRCAGVECCAV